MIKNTKKIKKLYKIKIKNKSLQIKTIKQKN